MAKRTIWILLSMLITGIIFNSCSEVTPIEPSVSAPKITITTTNLAFGEMVTETSKVKKFSISGENLKGDITITSPNGYTIANAKSLKRGTKLFQRSKNSITIPHVNGTVVEDSISVSFIPSAIQNYDGNITCTSTEATTQIVTLTGSGVAPQVPTISVSKDSLEFGNVTVDSYAPTQSITILGSNLAENINITPPTGYEISKFQGTGFVTTPITLVQVGGAVSMTQIYVRIKPTSEQPYNGNITCVSSGAVSKNVVLTCIGTLQLVPVITVKPPNLGFNNVFVGDSLVKNFKISAVNLTNDIIISSPNGYALSLVQNVKNIKRIIKKSKNNLTIPHGNGTIDSISISVTFKPTSVQSYSGNIICTSTGATVQSVALTGYGIKPIITIDYMNLNYGGVTINSSSLKTFKVSGLHLKSDITITTPIGYIAARTKGVQIVGKHRNVLVIPHVNGTIATTTINLTFSPTALQDYNDSVRCTSSGAVTQKIAVTGKGTPIPDPLITLSTTSISFGYVMVGNMAVKTFKVSGQNLTNNVVITTTGVFSIALAKGSKLIRNSKNSITIPHTNGTITDIPVSVTFTPTNYQQYTGNVSCTSVGATSQDLAVSGIAPTPSISVSPTSLNFSNVMVYTTSIPQSFTVTGTNVNGLITVTAPAGYEVATSKKLLGKSKQSITIPAAGGIVYARFKPTAIQGYNGNISLTATGADTRTVLVTGTGVDVNFVWTKQVGGTGGDVGNSIKIDSQGNKYITGLFSGTATFGGTTLISQGETDIFIAKMDPSGNFLWAKQAGGTANDCGNALAIDAQGNLFIGGYFEGYAIFGTNSHTALGVRDLFVSKMDATGNFLWTKQAGGTGGTNFNYVNSIAVDAQGKIYLAGCFSATVAFGSTTMTAIGSDNDDLFIAKMDASGDFLWARQAKPTHTAEALSLAIGTQGDIYVTGYFLGQATFGSTVLFSSGSIDRSDIFVAKLDGNGNYLWVKQAGGTSYEHGKSITIDSQGKIYITGFFSGTAVFFGSTTLTSNGDNDGFVAKMDASGNLIWVKSFGGKTGTDVEWGASIAVDADCNSYITGFFIEAAQFGSISLASLGNTDIFVAKMDTNGDILWAKQAGGNFYDHSNSIAIDTQGNSFITGYFGGTASFGSTTLNSAGENDIFISKVGQSSK